MNNTEQINLVIGQDGSVGIGTTEPGGLLGLKNANTYLDVDGSNNLTFTDAPTGTKTLAELAIGGGGGGWVDDGTVVRLETSADSVGIGTTEAPSKLSVLGNLTLLRVPGADISPGPGHEISLQSPTSNTATQRSEWVRDDAATDDCDGNQDQEYVCPPDTGGDTCQDVAKLGQAAGYYKSDV
ncbi:MAG: hypothetical protein COT67_00190, partial [Candidatus Tagabacteria bacterium CG09_land_8_20_14_0_10_41_14]